jgi:hypothetical protein
MALGEIITSAVVGSVVGEMVKPSARALAGQVSADATMGGLAHNPQTLPQSRFPLGELFIFGVLAYAIAKEFKWI